jgi:hypothetical protein
MKLLREQPEMLAIPILLALLGLFVPGDLNFVPRPFLQGLGFQPAIEEFRSTCPAQVVPPRPVFIPEGAELI